MHDGVGAVLVADAEPVGEPPPVVDVRGLEEVFVTLTEEASPL